MKIEIPEPPRESVVIIVVEDGHYNYGAVMRDDIMLAKYDFLGNLVQRLRRSLLRGNQGEFKP